MCLSSTCIWKLVKNPPPPKIYLAIAILLKARIAIAKLFLAIAILSYNLAIAILLIGAKPHTNETAPPPVNYVCTVHHSVKKWPPHVLIRCTFFRPRTLYTGILYLASSPHKCLYISLVARIAIA